MKKQLGWINPEDRLPMMILLGAAIAALVLLLFVSVGII